MNPIAAFERVSAEQYTAALKGNENALAWEEITLPRRATSGSAGYDFASTIDAAIEPGESVLVPTGIRARMEPGWVLLIFPRSSLGMKYGIRLSNSVGVIDCDYYHADNEGHIMVRLYNGGKAPYTLRRGERCCQGIFLPFGIAEEEAVSAGRTGGFGSTGA